MRIASIIISMGAGAYVVWQLGNPVPVLVESCRDNTNCAAALPTAAAEARLPGLRVELYDPAMEPRLRDAAAETGPVWISSAETPWIVAAGGRGGPPPGPGPVAPATFSLAGLGQPGASGICLVRDGGKRRCVAFIGAHDE
jgi:hypothetical protein